ncbi:calcium-binding protein [uncultured Sulfitobacter sp.]|uniref:calcium-binding protein n=1 Tax=uncultured Sulfitobacter sp. TaxID=191468 RepID=UPI00263955EA|nr:calcium-binding protein [uncultured Sulfitobacter sp.]
MPFFNFYNFLFGNNVNGSDKSDLIIGTFGKDHLNGNGGDDLIFGLFGDDKISGGDGEDHLDGGSGNDVIVGNKGNDKMFGGHGNDLLVWNNGDGSDLMDGGKGYDAVQVNFNTDLVNDDLQNKDVAEFSSTEYGVQFARIEVNDQTERGLFQLDIRNTETLETNFGGGDDTAVLKGDVLNDIYLDLDGGKGVDTLDLSQVADGVNVNLKAGKLDGSTAQNFENVIGTAYDDTIKGDNQDNEISGLDGADKIFGRSGDDTLVGGKGDDIVKGGQGDDDLVWNNGDGSDLMDGGKGNDLVQVNFDTDLVNDDLQNKDVAEFSVTDKGVAFARIEVNDQTERGLFNLDVRNTETLETNFGGGEDTAVLVDNILDKIVLDLDGGAGIDTLDFSQLSSAVEVDLAAGTMASAGGTKTSTAVNFENIEGTAFDDTITGDDQDNVIRGGAGNDVMQGGEGADTFVFFEEDQGVDVILDFELGVDSLAFFTTDPDVTTENLLGNMTQNGDHVDMTLNNKVVTFENTSIADFSADDFLIM